MGDFAQLELQRGIEFGVLMAVKIRPD